MKRLKKKSFKFKLYQRFDKISSRITKLTGRPVAFLSAFLLIAVWAFTGPVFKYSDTWQLVINTGTTIITFLMVFIIQQSQNKDTTAIQLKLNELIACNENASNRLVDVEDLTDEELQALKTFYIKLSRLAEKDNNLFSSHSLDENSPGHYKLKSSKTNNSIPSKPPKSKTKIEAKK